MGAAVLRPGARLGKYKIVRRIGSGGFADVYRARDTLEGIEVALKLPLPSVDPEWLSEFQREARVVARLEHPNILPLKSADLIDDRFVLAYRLGEESLAARLGRRYSTRQALDWAIQLTAGLAFAHEHRVIHCDVKPDNAILFTDGSLRLTDFGIARVASKTVLASVAAGTVGYMAPEQALGRPSARSDVFAAALVAYRLLAGTVPLWPFAWPPRGIERIRRSIPELEPVLRRALEVDARKRYRDAMQLLSAVSAARRGWQRRCSATGPGSRPGADWRKVRMRQLRRLVGARLDLRHRCGACHLPVDERMRACPWCGDQPLCAHGETTLPSRCPRCERGTKLDWKYCAWCPGAAIGPASTRRYTDRRYTHRCTACRGQLLPHSRYCSWCRAKVRRSWPLGKGAKPCGACRQPVFFEFWSHCPWCARSIAKRRH